MDTDLRELFTYLGHMEDTSSVILKCTNCKKELRRKRNDKWNFIRHVKKVQPDKIRDNSQLGQPSLEAFLKEIKDALAKVSLQSSEQKDFEKLLLDLVPVDGMPLSVLERIAFRSFTEKFLPRFNIVSRKTITCRITIEGESTVKPALRLELRHVECRCLHLSLDFWTSFSKESVIGVKVYFIDSAWELRSDVLAFATFEVVHTGKNIESKVESLQQKRDLKPEHIGFVMTDNATNIVKAFKVPSTEQQERKSVVRLKNAERSIAEDDSEDEGQEDCDLPVDAITRL
ncbi:hypothetical protein V5799_003240, partial [Amblyomma americanum]